MNRDDYFAAAKNGANAFSAWAHVHTFLAGLIFGALAGFFAKWFFF